MTMAWQMPVTKFRICAITPSSMMMLDPLLFSPEAAIRRNPEKFIELAREMWRVARKYAQENAQMEMNLPEGDPTGGGI